MPSDNQGTPAGTGTVAPKAAAQSAVPALRPPVPAPDGGPPRRRRRWLWFGGAALVVVLAALAWLQPWTTRLPVVGVETAAMAPATRVLAVNGRIAAVRSVDLRPSVSGTLVSLDVEEGEVVAPDQVLARIDAQAQNAVLRQAMAGLDAALVAQTGARDTYDRSVALGANIARSVLDANARAVQSAAEQVAQATAQVDQARIALDAHTIRAPIAGTVIALDVEPGQQVGPTTVLTTLADMTDLLVETDVDETYATQIARGQPAMLQLAGEGGTRPGTVRFVSARVDAATGGLAVRIAFDDPVSAPVGLTVTANIVVDRRDAALTVPRTALVSPDGQTGVFIVVDGVATFRPLQVVDWPAARLIVAEGLTAGDVVIVDPTGIAAGQRVEARPADSLPAPPPTGAAPGGDLPMAMDAP